jgi:DNA-binding IclR family transcriptional regulator
MNTSNPSTNANVTADKAIEILLLFTPAKPVWTQQEISTQLNMSRSTTYRYISSLRSTGLVVQDERGSFCLGPRLLHMAQAARIANPIVGISGEPMRVLSTQFREVVILNELAEREILELTRIDSPQDIIIRSTRTQMLPWPATGSSKVLLAYSDDAIFEDILSSLTPTQFTQHTIATLENLRMHLDLVRRQGYAISDEERDEGIWGVAVPILQGQRCSHSLSVVGPKFRFSKAQRDAMIAATIEAGCSISAKMGS